MDTSEDLEDRSLGQGRSLSVGARAPREAPAAAAAANKGWVLHMAAHASSLPGPLGSEAAEQERETLGKSLTTVVRSLSVTECSKKDRRHMLL